METILFATKSNGAISEADFKPLAKPVTVKPDFVYKNGKFTIDSKFLEDQTENSGWTIGAGAESGRLFLVKILDDSTTELAQFLKKDKPTRTFSSKAIEYQLDQKGINKDQSFNLVQQEESLLKDAITYQLVPSAEFGKTEPNAIQQVTVEELAEEVAVSDDLTAAQEVPTLATEVPAVELAPEAPVEQPAAEYTEVQTEEVNNIA